MNVINHTCAAAAAQQIVNLYCQNNGRPKAEIYGEILFLIRHVIDRATDMKREAYTEPSTN